MGPNLLHLIIRADCKTFIPAIILNLLFSNGTSCRTDQERDIIGRLRRLRVWSRDVKHAVEVELFERRRVLIDKRIGSSDLGAAFV